MPTKRDSQLKEFYPENLAFSRRDIAEMLNAGRNNDSDWEHVTEAHPNLTNEFCQELVEAIPIIPGETEDSHKKLYVDDSGQSFTKYWIEKIKHQLAPIYSKDPQQQELITLLLKGSGDISSLENLGSKMLRYRELFNHLAALHKVLKVAKDKIIECKGPSYFNSQLGLAMKDWINEDDDDDED